MKKIALSALISLSLFALIGCAAESDAEGLTADQAAKAMATAVTTESPAVEEAVILNDAVAVAENLKELNALIDEQEKVTEAEVADIVDGVVSIGIDEILTIPIMINAAEEFSAFGFTIGFNDSKIEIVSSSLSNVEGSFSGLYAVNLNYNPELTIGNNLKKDSWAENIEVGLSKTVLVGGAAASGKFVGKMILCTITIKGVSAGETFLNQKFLEIANTEGQMVEVPTFEKITLMVE